MDINWTQMGWVCPKCGAVMSPTTSCCINCRGKNSTSVSTGNTIDSETGIANTDLSNCGLLLNSLSPE